MAILVWTDATVFLDELDASGHASTAQLVAGADVKDGTTYADNGWRNMVPGLKTAEFSYEAFGDFAANSVDAVEFANLGTNVVHTVTPHGDDSDVAYSFLGVRSSYQQNASIGELFKVTGGAMNAREGAIRGRLLLPKQTVSGDVNGTGVQLGDVAATEHLYTAIHVFSAGTTATIIVESDDNSGFTTPTTRSSTVVTATGGTWVTRVAGAITDDWWRVRTASVTGSFSVAVSVGIQ